MQKHGDWEEIEPLGRGGQSDVYLVRTPQRAAERKRCLEGIRSTIDRDKRAELATAIWSYARPDSPSELGALKVFKIPAKGQSLQPLPESAEYEAVERLKNEITVLGQNRPGLPKLLGFNEDERWIVTEFFPEGTLERHFSKYQGKVAPALRAFRSLVETTASLHNDGFVHRDIKPANVFVRKADELVLGDFGIVYIPTAAERLTLTNERVGPRDYMPPWGDIERRLENVQPKFDVYMLGKLLWCMVAGRLKLPREWHRRPEYDLTQIFNADPQMHMVNEILDKCVVEEPERCLSWTADLLAMVNSYLAVIDQGGQLLTHSVPRPCHVCGLGSYQPETLFQNHPAGSIRFWFSQASVDTVNLSVRPFTCSSCGHVQFFKAVR